MGQYISTAQAEKLPEYKPMTASEARQALLRVSSGLIADVSVLSFSNPWFDDPHCGTTYKQARDNLRLLAKQINSTIVDCVGRENESVQLSFLSKKVFPLLWNTLNGLDLDDTSNDNVGGVFKEYRIVRKNCKDTINKITDLVALLIAKESEWEQFKVGLDAESLRIEYVPTADDTVVAASAPPAEYEKPPGRND